MVKPSAWSFSASLSLAMICSTVNPFAGINYLHLNSHFARPPRTKWTKEGGQDTWIYQQRQALYALLNARRRLRFRRMRVSVDLSRGVAVLEIAKTYVPPLRPAQITRGV